MISARTLCAAVCAFAVSTGPALAQPASVPAPAASAAPSIAALVFQPAYREAIDSRCPKARAGADAIAANFAAVDLNVVNTAEKDFFDCAKLPRLPQAKDQTLYMELAAATCFYLIGSRTGGATKKAALAYAAQIAGNLAPAVDHSKSGQGTGGDQAGGGANAMSGSVAHNAVHADVTEDADPLGSRYDPAILRKDAAMLQDLIADAGS